LGNGLIDGNETGGLMATAPEALKLLLGKLTPLSKVYKYYF
jgi:hypothetical protein